MDSQQETLAEDVRQAENRQEELNHILQEIRLSLQPLSKESADLVEQKEQLEEKITKKKKLQEELMSKEDLIGDTEVFEKLKADLQDSIDRKRKSLVQVEEKIEEQRAKEKRLKMEVAEKEKELDENERFVGELKQKHLVICSALETKRRIFDSELRQKHKSKQKLPKECKVSVCYVIESAFFLQNFACS